MKILFFATVYEYGGISKIIGNILNNLDRKKFKIVLCAESVASRHYPFPGDIRFMDIDLRPAKGILKLLNIPAHLCRMRKIIAAERPDIIVGFGSSMNWQLALISLQLIKNRPKMILSEYSEQFFIRRGLIKGDFKERMLKIIYRTIMFLLYHRADAIICVSNSLAEHIEKLLLMDRKKIKVIYVPVNIKEIRVLSEKTIQDIGDKKFPCVGTISRLSREKGVAYLIEAFYYLLKRIDARLIIIGDGEEKDKLKEMVKNFGVENRVSFLDWLENPYAYLRRMDIFILPSLWEGFPNVIIESMICGVPVIATRSVRGIEEAVRDGIDGLLVPVKDARALSDAMYRILRDKELRDRLVETASGKISRFDAPRITREYESVMLGA